MLLFLVLASGVSADCGFSGPCPQDGLFPCPNDCGKYVNCGNGKPYVMECASHTYFHPSGPNSGNCNWGCPWTAPPTTTSRPPVKCYPETYDCDLPEFEAVIDFPCDEYYICQDGQKCKYQCPEGFLFDPNDNLCKEKGKGPECVYGGNHKDPLDPLKPFFEVVDLS